MTMVLVERPASVPLKAACDALGLARSSVYQRSGAERPVDNRGATPPVPHQHPRALTAQQREQVLNVLNSERFADQPAAQVYATLLSEGQYLCSIRTMQRLLKTQGASGERRAQREPVHHPIPRLQARAPHEVWTWDISKLATVQRGVYLSLYVVLDLYSRYVVAWMISRRENSALARQLLRESIARYRIKEGALTVHQDRGAPMTAHAYLNMLDELNVTPSHSRPRVSNDNPFSESHFKTGKYQPDYPGKFAGHEHARLWWQDFFTWYNGEHHHSGLALFTPAQVFTGEYHAIADRRQQALDQAYADHPERFVNAKPRVAMPPAVVEINPVTDQDNLVSTQVNFPTHPVAVALSQRRDPPEPTP